MSDTAIPKRNLGESPTTLTIPPTQTTETVSNNKNSLIGAVYVASTKKESEGTFAKAIKKEYNDTNMSQS